MNVTEIANRLNEHAFQEKHDFAKLQDIRGSSLRKPFTGHSIFEDYFFHTGGRNEIQFNIGADWIGGKDVVRYGLAFSFQRGRNLQNPLETITPRVDWFNKHIETHPQAFADVEMWYHWNAKDGSRQFSETQPAGKIPRDWIGLENFIFVGKHFDKEIPAISEDDLEEMLSFFDRILPVYEFVEQNAKKENIVLNKISKLCWNTNNWQSPSGPMGKSGDKNSHEFKFGYGHEEWLFDFEKLIDGYHYAFLQPINKYRDKYKGETFNITLYTVDSDDSSRYWVAEIKNAFMIEEDEENAILEEYRKQGWIDEMYAQLEQVGADVENFKEWEERTLFNVRFKPQDVRWYDNEPVSFAAGESISHTRYTLLNKSYVHSAESSGNRKLRFGDSSPRATSPVSGKARAGEIEYSRLHNEIQNSLLTWLQKNNPDAKQIGLECSVGRAKVDAAIKTANGNTTFFEVKTFNDARTCIRQAIGQLLEYSHYPEDIQADKLNVVSHAPLDENSRKYLAHLRDLYALPIGYIQFDHEKSEIIEEI